MGTTLTAVYVGEDEVADRPRRATPAPTACATGELLRLTDDHSLVDELIREGTPHPRGSRGAPPALDHHPRARPRRDRRGGHPLLPCARRGPLPALQRRAHLDGRRSPPRRAPAPARPRTPARRRRGADRRGQPRGRTRQHHGDPAAPRGGGLEPTHPWRPAEGHADDRSETDRHATLVGVLPWPRRPRTATLGRNPPRRPRTATLGGHAPRRAWSHGALAPRLRRAPPRPGGAGAAPAFVARCPRWSYSPCSEYSPPAAYVASQSVYFVATNSRGLVTLYQGLPYQLPGGLELYSSYYVSGVGASTLEPRSAS